VSRRKQKHQSVSLQVKRFDGFYLLTAAKFRVMCRFWWFVASGLMQIVTDARYWVMQDIERRFALWCGADSRLGVQA